jgi:hypothetical protein
MLQMKNVRPMKIRGLVFAYRPRGALSAFMEVMNHQRIERNFLREFQVPISCEKSFL